MQTSQRRQITRNREQLACIECRKRKLKCDRNVPCGSCIKRNDEASCTYQRFARAERERARRLEAEARLEHLEELVQQLSASQNSGSEPRSQTTVSSLSGHHSLTSTPTTGEPDAFYSGSTHWSAILDDIEELKFSIAVDEYDINDGSRNLPNDDAIDMLFGGGRCLPFDEILDQYLPSRTEADGFVATYFRAQSLVAPFLHKKLFTRRYGQFWLNPRGAPPLWTSIFFLICHVSNTAIALHPTTDQPDNKYILAAAHCLTIGKYHKPGPFAVEALLLFVQSKLFGGFDATSDIGMIMATTVHLAVSSGYHRDPDIFNLSPFEKEIRRRTWSLCMQLDLLISFALGHPSNLPFSMHDTPAPRNLLDSDFDEDDVELPPERPDHEITAILFYITKHKLLTVFEKILRHSLSSNVLAIDVLEGLDTELNETYTALPEIIKPQSVAESLVDSPTLIFTRLCVLFMYSKCRCVLHRKYAAAGRVLSLEICYEASRSIIEYFTDVFPTLQPQGQLESDRWFSSTLTWHDFLLGVVVLCLVLCVSSQNLLPANIDRSSSISWLNRARTIFEEISNKSRYTKRVQKLIEATILRVNQTNQSTGFTGFSQGQFNSTAPNSIPAAPGRPSNGLVAGIHGDYAQDSTLYPEQNAWGSGWDESTTCVDDISWTYLDQFLDLGNFDPETAL